MYHYKIEKQKLWKILGTVCVKQPPLDGICVFTVLQFQEKTMDKRIEEFETFGDEARKEIKKLMDQ